MLGSSPTLELLRELADLLGRLRLRWYLFGAQAAAIYGSPRATADVDVTVELGSLELAQFIDSLGGGGFPARVADPLELAATAHVLPLVHSQTAMPVDVVLAGSGLERDFLDRARPVELDGGVVVPVITPEDLVIAKILAGRPRDLADAGAVLRAQSDLSLERVRSVLSLLEQALDQSDLLPALERIVDSHRR